MKNIIHKAYLLLVFILPVIILSSCDKYLDEMPSKSSNVEIKTAKQLGALLSSYYPFFGQLNKSVLFGSDDYEIPVALYDAYPSKFKHEDLMWYLWDVDNIKTKREDKYLEDEYKKIFIANVVLANVDKVEGDTKYKEQLRAEAHFIRAYSNWSLANTYCLPYSTKNFNELGLSYKTETNYEQNIKRKTLKETYDFIESDLSEALKSTNNDITQIWRGNIYAIKAFMARFLMFKGDYVNGLKYANEVLAVKNTLVDYNTEMKYDKDIIIKHEGKQFNIKVPQSFYNQLDPVDTFEWKEFLYLRVLVSNTEWFIPSKSLLNLYDKTNDLRYKYHIVEDYSYNKGIFKVSAPGYFFFNTENLPSGPTVAEMYLIKAECNARLGRSSEAMTAINTLRAKRMISGSHVNLTASSNDDALIKVLQERRRECPFSARWFDIRRFNNNETAVDDVVLKRSFYPYDTKDILRNQPVKEYTLSKLRYAAPFIDKEISLSYGQLEQNKY
ncbi:MAG: RagB/SusD family nutrient uptake outer membrane protein [Marinifilaceae bacterium]